ncbi:MAG: PQQ-binding-like beta-propeller repeat protein [Planctomycetia bacterium]|nr:MAG: PQQ-binding-like beta-propeller repeat protein [Planctomycetia bacterium]
MLKRTIHVLGVLASCGFFATSARAANWPQWRGPGADGICAETGIPTEWSRDEHVVWRTAVPGLGHSSPIVWNGTVFLTTSFPDQQQRALVRVDAATGRILWQRVVVTAPLEHIHKENSYASSTPATDGQRVYTSFAADGRVNLQAYDFAGNKVWEARPTRFKGEHGYSYAPILWRDLLFLDCNQNDESALLALDTRTGKVRWRVDKAGREVSHVAPLVVRSAGKWQLLACGSNRIQGFDPATGTEIWSCQGPTDVCIAGLAFGDDILFAAGGYPDRTRMAVRTTGTGDVTGTHVLWKSGKAVPYVPSPVYHDGYFYSILDNGILYCFEAKTGEIAWQQRLGGRYRSSLVLVEGNLWATSDKGVTTICRASPEAYEQVAVNDLGEFCYTTPAISRGRIYVRTKDHLYCIGANHNRLVARAGDRALRRLQRAGGARAPSAP